MRNKNGVFCMAGGLALLLAALCLTGYNLWDDSRAADAVKGAMQVLRVETPVLEELDLPEEMIPAFVFLLTGKSLSLHARKTRVTDQLLITGI